MTNYILCDKNTKKDVFKIDIALVLFASLTAAVNTVLGKAYNIEVKEYKTRTEGYNLIMVFTALTIWAVAFFAEFSFDFKALPYSLIFGVGYVMACYGYLSAIRYGSVALSALFSKFSLIGATIWGLIFWNAKVTSLTIIGLVLAALSVFFCVYKKEKNSVNLKWLFFSACAFSGNVACTVIQKQEQMDFGGKYGNFFMFLSMLFAAVISFVLYLVKSGINKPFEGFKIVKGNVLMPFLSGGSNYLMNLFVMTLATSTLNPAFIYPTISVVGISITTLASVFLFKEKPTRIQWVGIILGTIACVILSL